MIIGAILVLGAMALFVYNEYLDSIAGKNSSYVVSKIRVSYLEIDSNQVVNKDASFDVSVDGDLPIELIPPMAVITIDEHDYIGTIIIPDLNIELPVMSEWRNNYDDLKISPVRYHGSVYTDDMVIAGHNYRSHFNPLHNSSVGMEVIFEDVYGQRYYYEIVEFETIEPTAVTDMIEFDADLTLFTCTYGGTARFAVRCDRIDK